MYTQHLEKKICVQKTEGASYERIAALGGILNSAKIATISEEDLLPKFP
jgi:hypothetical protein